MNSSVLVSLIIDYTKSVAIVDSIATVALVVLWGVVFGPCFVVQYLVSFLVFYHLAGEERHAL